MKIIIRYKSAFWFTIATIVFFVFGKIFFAVYEASPRDVVDIQEFRKIFSEKEKQTQQTLSILQQKIENGSTSDSLLNVNFRGNDIIYYVYKNNRLVFWTDNLIAPNNGIDFQEDTAKYIKMPNNNCVYISRTTGNVKIIALILIKFSYSSETQTLRNHFASDFHINANILVTQGDVSDIYAVHDSEKNYLFSLQMPAQPIFSNIWLIFSFVAYLLFFLAFFITYAFIPKLLGKNCIALRKFLPLAVGVGLAVFFVLFYQIPSGFFGGAALIFRDFTAGNFWDAGYVTVFSFYCVSTFYLLTFVDMTAVFRKYRYLFLVAQLAFFGIFLLFDNTLHSEIFNSLSHISILALDDFTFERIWLHALIGLWGVGFIFLFTNAFAWISGKRDYLMAAAVNLILVCAFFVFSKIFNLPFSTLVCFSFAVFSAMFLFGSYFFKKVNIYSNVLNAIYIFVMTGLVVLNIFYFEKESRQNIFRKVAENILATNADETRLLNTQLVKMNMQIADDQMLKSLVSQRSSHEDAEHYLEEKYLTDNLSNYESTILVYKKNSVDFNNYSNLVTEYGSRVAQSAFYQISMPQSANSFVGIFDLNQDSLYFVLNLEPIRGFRSYSFPNLLINNDKSSYSHFNIATAKYIDGNLASSSGRLMYPSTTAWLPLIYDETNGFLYNGRNNYVFAADNATNVAVVTDLQNHKWGNYVIYFFYSFLIYFLLVWLSVWLFFAFNHKKLKINIITRFQYMFFVLIVLSFVGVFVVSSEFIKGRYREQQTLSIDEKITYIQRVLQEKYFYNLSLNNSESGNLTDDLQDLSYTFQTDIHIYSNDGLLIATTQPMIFNKNLISRRISPEIFFTNQTTFNKDEQIGTLNYLISYSEFFNGDNLQIGYIAIPQYFSELDINNETLNLLKMIVHIYVIAFIIALIFSNIIRRQLSKPLLDLENKLRAMRLGKRNEKIEYKSNDEISQLVEQYNITVDELDRSARLLAKSEREGAWKLMARQIAHEINNPLTPMKLSIQQLQRTKKIGGKQFDDYFDKSTKILVEQIDNLSHIAGTFSLFARTPEAKFERTNLTKKVGSVVELFKNNDKDVIINYLFAKRDIYVFADPEQLQQVFNNLIKNAIQAIPEQPEKFVEVRLQSIDNKAIVTITDNGLGIAPEIVDKLFLPSFTTKSTGTGLGLAISKNIVETADGAISFANNEGKGTTFKVELPQIN
ncbi:MAG: GHKL domain-containing protein [Prevotellaceae bacterium]|jgi:signal transduction histidine kinase|nr:GHKL domain-containing protein [Prevotellaceae bacterium]